MKIFLFNAVRRAVFKNLLSSVSVWGPLPFIAESVFVNILRSPEIDAQPSGIDSGSLNVCNSGSVFLMIRSLLKTPYLTTTLKESKNLTYGIKTDFSAVGLIVRPRICKRLRSLGSIPPAYVAWRVDTTNSVPARQAT